MITAEKATFNVPMMCRMLDVSRSGYYKWPDRPAPASALRWEEPTEMIVAEFEASGSAYGQGTYMLSWYARAWTLTTSWCGSDARGGVAAPPTARPSG